MSDYWNRWQRKRLGRRGFIAGAGTAGIGAAALGLVGCGDDDDDSGDDGGTTSTGTAGSSTTVAAGNLKDLSLEEMREIYNGGKLKNVPGWSEGPKTGGILRFASRTPITWDPTSAAGSILASYAWANNQLVQIRANDQVENPNFMEYDPVLAETMPEQPDDTTFIFKLHKGVKFQNVDPVNGRELTADDIIYSTEAYMESPAQSPAYDEVDSMEKVDDYTVKFNMKRPAAHFIPGIATPFHWIFSREQHESADGLVKKPIGTGGLILEEAVDQGGYKFVKNPDYFRKDPTTGDQLPYIDGLETTFYPSPAQSIAAFRAGQVDHLWPQNFDTWVQVMESNPDSVTQVTTPPPSYQPFIAMRLDKAPFSDPRVRRALSLLIDRDAIIDGIFQGMAGYGYGQDWTYFGEEWPWKSEQLGNWNRYDVAEAKQLLEAAGVGDLHFQYLFQAFAGSNFEAWQATAGMLDAAGIKTTIDAPQDYAKFADQWFSGTFEDIVAVGSIGPGQDPDTFAYHAMHSESPKNYFKINDPKIDELALKQRQTFDVEERRAVLQELMDYDLDLVTRVWMVTPYKINMRKPNLFNLTDVVHAWSPVGWGASGLDTAWRSS